MAAGLLLALALQALERVVEHLADVARMSDPESNWSSVERAIASLLEEIPREDAAGVPQDRAPLSDAPSTAYRFLWAVLLVSTAAVVISRFALPRLVRGIAHSMTQQRSACCRVSRGRRWREDRGLLEGAVEHHALPPRIRRQPASRILICRASRSCRPES
jgi:hypothetical protein